MLPNLKDKGSRMTDCILGYAVLRVYKDANGDCHVSTDTAFPSYDVAKLRAMEYRRTLNSNWDVAVAQVELKVKEILK